MSAAESHSDVPWSQSIYDQLHEIAQQALRRESPGHSLQPTLLVNDAYMQLLKQRNVNRADKSQVLAVGATIIRRMLVDHARKRLTAKRGGDQGRGVGLDLSIVGYTNGLDVIELNDALAVLAKRHERAEKVVELRFFGGLVNEEIAEHLNISLRTVNSDWRFAKAWLYREMGPQSSETPESEQ